MMPLKMVRKVTKYDYNSKYFIKISIVFQLFDIFKPFYEPACSGCDFQRPILAAIFADSFFDYEQTLIKRLGYSRTPMVIPGISNACNRDGCIYFLEDRST